VACKAIIFVATLAVAAKRNSAAMVAAVSHRVGQYF
jgi:hypothetical protein